MTEYQLLPNLVKLILATTNPLFSIKKQWQFDMETFGTRTEKDASYFELTYIFNNTHS